MKIGFLDRSDASWSAGASYTRSMVNALASALSPDDELWVVARSNGAKGLPPTVRVLEIGGDRPTIRDVENLIASENFDALLPLTEVLSPQTPGVRIGWIPDFQHRRLPQYYSEDQRKLRDWYFGELIASCDSMMFSSRSVQSDFEEFYPESAAKGIVVPFPSSLAYSEGILEDDPTAVLKKYRLPPAFALVVNQFWKHKNHRLVVEAVAKARQSNPSVCVVMIGMPSDSRDITNAHLSEIFRRLSVGDFHQNVRILGEVPFPDLLALLRCAAEVIQPSEFEGWSTTVEDALTLGKPVACSDIATHREQAPGADFFSVYDSAELAAHLVNFDWSHSGWVGSEAEKQGIERERERGQKWGATLLERCRQQVASHRKNPPSRERAASPRPKIDDPSWHIEHLRAANERLRQNEGRLKDQVITLKASALKARNKAEELTKRIDGTREEAAVATQRYWDERNKPLHVRLREAIFGRTES